MLKAQYFTVSALCVVLLLYFHFASEVPVDSGDGLAHFFIAQHVWNQPIELLNHWGKPLFTLLASPSAFFGYSEYIFFNITLFLATVWVGFVFTQKVKLQSSLILIFPIGLLTSIDYTSNILGGMTEVLFGFLLLFSGLLLLQKRWFWFSVLISFMPFARSEGQLLIPMAAMLLIYYKQLKFLPLLGFGFVVYAVIGSIALGDFWWYFSQNPYTGASVIYGKGTWFHYIDFWYVHLGVLGLVFMICGIGALIFAWFKRPLNRDKSVVLLYFILCYFGILLVHIYLWANGKNGAIGLTRLAIHGWPGVLISCILLINHALKSENFKNVISAVSLFFGAWIVFDFPFVHEQPFPRKAMPDERAIVDATLFADSLVNENQVSQVLYFHPLVAYAAGANLKSADGMYVQRYFNDFSGVLADLKPNDIIIRDSHFANRDMNFPDDKLDLFEEVAVFTPLDQYVHAGNRVSQVHILRLKQNTSYPNKTTLLDSLVSFHADDLYPSLITVSTGDFKLKNQKFEIELHRQTKTEELFYLVIQSEETGESLTFEIGDTNIWSFSLNKKFAKTYKFYIHNPHGAMNSVKIKITEIQ